MAPYSTLNKEEIQEILSGYNFQEIESISVLGGGSLNTNFKIRSGQSNLVLTVCEQMSEKSATELAFLLEYLAEHNFRTSKLIRTAKDGPVSFWRGKPVLLKEFIRGTIVSDFSLETVKTLGAELGKLHHIPAPGFLPSRLNYGIECFSEAGKYAPNSSFHFWLEEIQHYILKYLSDSLPRGLIHGDIFYDNIIIGEDGERVVIMDFEEARNYYRVYDLGMILVGVCSFNSSVDLKKAKKLLAGYAQTNKILDIEREYLKAFSVYAAAATAFWRHRQYHFNHPDPKMYTHYLAMKNLADHIRELPDGCFFS